MGSQILSFQHLKTSSKPDIAVASPSQSSDVEFSNTDTDDCMMCAHVAVVAGPTRATAS